MLAEHPDAELAPRDVVTRVIQARLAAGRPATCRCATSTPTRPRRFPNLAEGCARLGFDLARDPLPVAPAAHYLMGGIATDLTAHVRCAGLFAAGEAPAPARTARTGWRRTRCSSAWSSPHAPPPPHLTPTPRSCRRPAAGAARSRGAARRAAAPAWTGAGPVATPTGSSELGRLADGQPEPNPVAVAGLIARAALSAREPRRSLSHRLARLDPTWQGRIHWCASAARFEDVDRRALAEDIGRGDLTTEADRRRRGARARPRSRQKAPACSADWPSRPSSPARSAESR